MHCKHLYFHDIIIIVNLYKCFKLKSNLFHFGTSSKYILKKVKKIIMFKLHSDFKPTGDQPQAIENLVKGLNDGKKFQTLLGVTGSGKTFTMANIIEKIQKPTLVLAHNKTLAGQLYSEFKEFFPRECSGVLCFILRLLST